MTLPARSYGTEVCHGTSQTHEIESSSRNPNPPFGGGWHVMLAQLIVTLRSCLPVEECNLFDQVHASAHRKEVPIGQFLVFALDVIRKNAPHLEGGFRHIFMLRTASRRRIMQSRGSSRASSRGSSPCARPCASTAQEEVHPDELVNQALKRFSGMCMSDSTDSLDRLGERKRQCDDSMDEDACQRERKLSITRLP
eukprot:CAMPEP_0181324894 /NCGR_PEP_ID=MMETSP1101-20121128/20619_1 /TAXON_ID=46948 /ORGANISM="Rhodomonas abbreviata, Strain Caron Lab Isolate" /LENGTH=195 /DNA_ID=CAMNT_0023433133 /DNA_START=178 /DNA_END=765 /DNA_ORIENTATION=+